MNDYQDNYRELEYMLKGLVMLESVYDLENNSHKDLQYIQVQDDVWNKARNTGMSSKHSVQIQDAVAERKPGEALQYFRDHVLEK